MTVAKSSGRSKGRVNQGGLSGGADSVVVKLRYPFKATNTFSVSSTQNQLFRLSSVYDPDYSGGGSQPNGFDQWAAVYNNYRVQKCKWKFNFCTTQGSNEPSYMCICPRLDNAAETSYEDLAGEARAKAVFSSGAGAPTKVLAGSCDLRKIWGLSKDEYDDQDFASYVNGNPSKNVYLSVLLGTGSGSTNSTLVTYYLGWIDFHVEFFGRQQLDPSFYRSVRLLEAYFQNLTTDQEFLGAVKKERNQRLLNVDPTAKVCTPVTQFLGLSK